MQIIGFSMCVCIYIYIYISFCVHSSSLCLVMVKERGKHDFLLFGWSEKGEEIK